MNADLCPDDPEIWNGYEDEDGCPDEIIGLGNPAHCGSILLQPIGGLIGPPSVACANASTPLLVRTVDDPSNPEELHRLLNLVDEIDHPLRSFEPLLIRVHDRSGAPAKGASVSYSMVGGENIRARAGMDGHLVLDRSRMRPTSALRVEWAGESRAVALASGPTLDVDMSGSESSASRPPSLHLAVIVDSDPEVELEAEALLESLDSVFAALRRSHRLTPKLALVQAADTDVKVHDFGVESAVLMGVVRRGFADNDGEAPREALAAALARAGQLDWPAEGGQVLMIVSRRAPPVDNAPMLEAVDKLRGLGVRIHPLVGRAPAAADEAWSRWAAAVTAGEIHLRSAWGDIVTQDEEQGIHCGPVESLHWSLVRALRTEVDGVERGPGPGLSYPLRTIAGGCTTDRDPGSLVAPEGGLRAVYAPGEVRMAPEAAEHREGLLSGYRSVLDEFPRFSLTITGHCDADEGLSAAALKDLSEQRAVRVRNLLVKGGVSAEQLNVVGVGASMPLGPSRSTEARAHNRRVEFSLFDSELGMQVR